MKTAYFDCYSGASGDMTVAALLDAGLSFDGLRDGLASLGLDGYSLRTEKVMRAGFAATKFCVDVEHSHDHPHRHLHHITDMIASSGLPEPVREQAIAVFNRLAQAEAAVHGSSIEKVHFHEVGAVDSIIDIAGACLGLHLLGIERIVSAPLRTGTGTVECAHGTLPVPAPATARLMVGFPVQPTDLDGELTTPTGAAILTTLADAFGTMPAMTVEALGLGAGTADRERRANILRVFIGETALRAGCDAVYRVETNIDDMSPEMFTHLGGRLLQAGALDYYYCPVQMKKSRPGVVINVLVSPDRLAAVEGVLYRHTTTFGLRRTVLERSCLKRCTVNVATSFGPIQVKLGYLDGEVIRRSPEYECCRRAAEQHGVPVIEVFEAARAAAAIAPCAAAAPGR